MIVWSVLWCCDSVLLGLCANGVDRVGVVVLV